MRLPCRHAIPVTKDVRFVAANYFASRLGMGRSGPVGVFEQYMAGAIIVVRRKIHFHAGRI